MSNPVHPRDPDELEGSLLPVATAVAPSDNGRTVPFENDDAVPVAAATPVSYFAYPDDDDSGNNDTTEQQLLIREVPAVPLANSSVAEAAVEEEQVRRRLAQGARTGLIDNDAQIQDIRKANRQVPAINYFTQRQLDQANRRARGLSRQENQQGWQGPQSELVAAPKASSSLSSARKDETNTPQGTFGKEYEVGQYEVKEYDTEDYQISEYKSLYDS
eukprot:scaffold8332_cov172-Amphora_coffeaeformis.AAC.8